ncbi:oligosaccharide flippase family protein [Microbacterium sp. NPDC087591]|uniref:oligosaccharide flippase family protein n=1 Tax=Microbacterium sp. NPDC087591 TaxID=3364192 RepID=UPI00380EB309
MTNSVSRATRGVLGLSMGTFIVQAVSAGSQLVLAAWLAPSEFGLWASAVSAMTLVTALTNFGEISGYLSGQGVGYRATRRRAFRSNLLLVLGGLLIAGLYLLWGKPEIALYCLVLALAIPLSGDADVKIAAVTRHDGYASIVTSQAAAAVAKFGLGLLIAVITHSAVAIAISTVGYYIVLSLLISRRARTSTANEPIGTEQPRSMARFSWAVNSYAMSLPIQAVFIAGQLFLTPTDLGVLYIAMQVTLALSSLISVPLNRVALSAFSRATDEERETLALGLGIRVVGTVTWLSAAIGLGLVMLTAYVPPLWQHAVPFALILLAGLPLRILSPVLEARQQSAREWWHATGFSLVDAVGSAAIVLVTAQSGDLLIVCLGITAWKALVGVTRTLVALRRLAPLALCALIALSIFACGLLLAASWVVPLYGAILSAGLLLILLLLTRRVVRRRRRRRARPAP